MEPLSKSLEFNDGLGGQYLYKTVVAITVEWNLSSRASFMQSLTGIRLQPPRLGLQPRLFALVTGRIRRLRPPVSLVNMFAKASLIGQLHSSESINDNMNFKSEFTLQKNIFQIVNFVHIKKFLKTSFFSSCQVSQNRSIQYFYDHLTFFIVYIRGCKNATRSSVP